MTSLSHSFNTARLYDIDTVQISNSLKLITQLAEFEITRLYSETTLIRPFMGPEIVLLIGTRIREISVKEHKV